MHTTVTYHTTLEAGNKRSLYDSPRDRDRSYVNQYNLRNTRTTGRCLVKAEDSR